MCSMTCTPYDGGIWLARWNFLESSLRHTLFRLQLLYKYEQFGSFSSCDFLLQSAWAQTIL